VLTGTSLWEEGVESIITTSDGLVWWHLTVRLDSVLEAEEFPACVTDLDTSLTDVDWDDFSHDVEKIGLKKKKIIIFTSKVTLLRTKSMDMNPLIKFKYKGVLIA
jgi:hypothetical protein